MAWLPYDARCLNQLIDLDFEKTSLDNVLKYLAEVTPGLSIVIDPDLAAMGIDLSCRVVDFKGKAVPIRGVLEVILGADLAYLPKEDHLLITSMPRLHHDLEIRTHRINCPDTWQNLLAVVQRAVNSLADRYIAPWDDEGGAATIEYFNGVLVVSQTRRGHERIEGLLRQLQDHGVFGPSPNEHVEKQSRGVPRAIEIPFPPLTAFVPQSTNEFDAFLCHASEDKLAVVEPFAKAMEEVGLKPWLDQGQVKWGDNLVQKIQNGLAKSRFVVVFISSAFLQKHWPEAELQTAISMEIGKKVFVLPVLLGIRHEELQARYPLVSVKMYKEIPKYDPASQVDKESLDPLIVELKDLLSALPNRGDNY